jgi:nucleoid-associated protein YgaU
VSNETNLGAGSGPQTGASAIGQTANIGRSTSVSSGAAKVFREFKWGLLTLFLLMVVVVGLVYDGGRQQKSRTSTATARQDSGAPGAMLDGIPETGTPPVVIGPTGQPAPAPMPPSPPVTPPVNTAPVIEDPVLGPAPLPPTNTPTGPDTRLVQGNPRPAPPAGVMGNPPPAPAPTAEKAYTVKSGDTLTSIASSQLSGKGGVKAILEANKDTLSNPDRLRVGMTLRIPAGVAAAKPESATGAGGTTAAPTPSKEATGYTVQNGDTLERIARKLFNDGRKWRDLYEWNRDQLSDPGRLRAGQVLRVKHGSSNTTATLPPAGSPRAEGGQDNGQPAVTESAATQGAQPQVMSISSSASLP